MMNPLEPGPVRSARKPSVVVPLLVGCGAFAIGAAMTFGYVQWKSQQQQLQLMTQMVEQMQQPTQAVAVAPQVVPQPVQQIAPQPVQNVVAQPVVAPASADVATRNVPVDLLTVTPAAPAPAAPTEVVPASAPAPAPAPAQDVAKSTADKIRELVARSSDPLVSAALAQDTARRETMSVAIQGVNELVEAAIAGDYSLTAVEGGGGVRMSFPGREEDQAQLEKLLSSAAGAGMIAFNASVKGSDGTYDGKIILFDLIERALVHGKPRERAAGEQIRQAAVALLGTGNRAIAQAAPADASGERVYTVEPGDSLAYIALQFYGNTNGYLRIFQANRDKLSSPERIQIGQKLVIPSA